MVRKEPRAQPEQWVSGEYQVGRGIDAGRGAMSSVATARLGSLAARLTQLSRFCGSGSQAEPIFTAPERLRAAQSGLAVQI
jgi:hypothetical protein